MEHGRGSDALEHPGAGSPGTAAGRPRPHWDKPERPRRGDLARDRLDSPRAISTTLREACSDERDLEVAVVIAARALGFVAKHLSGAGQPDGVAKFADYPLGQQKITLEAKASTKTPSLGALDMAGLAEHVRRENAAGCLLVAAGCPGGIWREDAAVAQRAEADRISCWTVEQYARVVEAVEPRSITVRQVLDIVLTCFSPERVSAAVDQLLQDPPHAQGEVVSAVLSALGAMERFGLRDQARTQDMLALKLARAGMHAPASQVDAAMRVIAAASRGAAMVLFDGSLQLNTGVEEIVRRTGDLLAADTRTRRTGIFTGTPEAEH